MLFTFRIGIFHKQQRSFAPLWTIFISLIVIALISGEFINLIGMLGHTLSVQTSILAYQSLPEKFDNLDYLEEPFQMKIEIHFRKPNFT